MKAAISAAVIVGVSVAAYQYNVSTEQKIALLNQDVISNADSKNEQASGIMSNSDLNLKNQNDQPKIESIKLIDPVQLGTAACQMVIWHLKVFIL